MYNASRYFLNVGKNLVRFQFFVSALLLFCFAFYIKPSITIFYVIPAVILLSCIVWFMETFKFRKFGYGFTFKHVSEPTPSDSLMDTLKAIGYNTEDISYVKMMCYGLSEGYTKDFILTLVRENKDVKIDLCGYGPRFETDGRVNFIGAGMPLEEHINIIGMKDGRTCIWYEPVHTIYNNKNYLPEGAFYSLSAMSEERAERLFKKICDMGKAEVPYYKKTLKTAYNVVKSSLLHPMETTYISSTTGNIIRVDKNEHD